MKNQVKKVYGEIANHGSTQTASVVLPSGKNYTESGDITNDLDEPYTTILTDVDGTKVEAIFEWKK